MKKKTSLTQPKEKNFEGLFFVLIGILFCLCLFGVYLRSLETKNDSTPTVNKLTIFRPLISVSNEIPLQRATTYWCDTAQCDSNPYSTADGSIIDPLNPQKWCALSRDLLHRWGGEFKYGDTIEVYSKEHPNLNGYWVVRDCMNAKYEMSIDFLMSPEKNKPKLGVGTDVKIIMCGHED